MESAAARNARKPGFGRIAAAIVAIALEFLALGFPAVARAGALVAGALREDGGAAG